MNEANDELWQARSKSKLSKRLLLKRVLWSVVQASFYRYSFHTWNGWRAMLLRLFGAEVGDGCTIRRTSRVYYPWNLIIGNLSCLGDYCEVYNLGKVTIGDRVTLSQESYLCAGTHDYTSVEMPLLTPPITLGSDSWICARAFIGPGVTVGEGAIVGAVAVAIKDVPPWTVSGGNPAKVIKERPRFAANNKA